MAKIRLFQPAPAWGLPNISPACMKLESFLRINELDYEIAPFDLSVAPTGKVPYIEDEGVLLGDSTLIIEHLKNKYQRDLDAHLSPAEKAVSVAFRRMLKEHTYWAMVHSRYAEDHNWAIYRELIMPLLLPGHPREIQEQAVEGFRVAIRAQLQGHGLGRHASSDVYKLGIEDLKAIADFLGDRRFFFGDRPSLIDLTILAYVGNIVEVPLLSPLKEYGLSRPNLVEYLRRSRTQLFPAAGL